MYIFRTVFYFGKRKENQKWQIVQQDIGKLQNMTDKEFEQLELIEAE